MRRHTALRRWSARAWARGSVVASEPCDDGDGWTDVPDRSLLVLTVDGVAVTELEGTA